MVTITIFAKLERSAKLVYVLWWPHTCHFGEALNVSVAKIRGKTMTLHEIIQDIHGLDVELTQLEKRYGLLSADFYHLYKTGELEQSRDFIQWVGYYETKLAREARYREVMYQHLRELRQQAGLGALHLAPEPTPAGAV